MLIQLNNTIIIPIRAKWISLTLKCPALVEVILTGQFMEIKEKLTPQIPAIYKSVIGIK